MKQYRWNDANLRKKSDRFSLLLGAIAGTGVFLLDMSVWWLLVLLIGRVLAKDKQLKPKKED